jgi:hypothetical protein
MEQLAKDLASSEVALSRIGRADLAKPHEVHLHAEKCIKSIVANYVASETEEVDQGDTYPDDTYTLDNVINLATNAYTHAYMEAVRQMYS